MKPIQQPGARWVWMVAVLGLMPMTTSAAAKGAAVGPPKDLEGAYAPPEDMTLERAVQNASSLEAHERLVEVTEPFLDAPYVLNPLGEEQAPDTDPRFRTDAFDCTTFVETAMAMSLADDAKRVPEVLDLIRYRDANVEFRSRRHFPGAVWLPDLIELGLLEDVTRDVAKQETEVAEKTIDTSAWKGKRRRHLAVLSDDDIPQGKFEIDVWPILKAKKGYKRIPPGTVLSVVRSNKKRSPARISHQGLVVEKEGKLYLRHAAGKVYHRVVDEPLIWFLARNAKYKKWPVTGVHLARFTIPDDDWQARARGERASADVPAQGSVQVP